MELAGGPRPATRVTILLVTGYDGAIIPQTLRGPTSAKAGRSRRRINAVASVDTAGA